MNKHKAKIACLVAGGGTGASLVGATAALRNRSRGAPQAALSARALICWPAAAHAAYGKVRSAPLTTTTTTTSAP